MLVSIGFLALLFLYKEVLNGKLFRHSNSGRKKIAGIYIRVSTEDQARKRF